MGNHAILDSKATDITAEDTWLALHTAELPDNVATREIHLSELLHKDERLDVILPLTEVVTTTGLITETLKLIGARSSRIGLWADTDVDTDTLNAVLLATKDKNATLMHALDLIVLYMPKFVDGRTFSQVRHLRQNGFQGEIRITGDFGRDQIAYFMRSGADSFVIAEENLTDDIAVSFYALPSAYDGMDASALPMFRTA